jgi:hypothetical protein
MKENDIKDNILATFVRHIIYQQCVSKLNIKILKKKKPIFLMVNNFVMNPKDVMFSMDL